MIVSMMAAPALPTRTAKPEWTSGVHLLPSFSQHLAATSQTPTLQFPKYNVARTNPVLKSSRTDRATLAVRSQASPGYVPEADFYKIEAILRPWRVSHVSSGLLKMGIRGVTISDVRGFGAQGGSTERHAGSEFSEDNFIAKVKVEIVVSKDQVEAVIDKIIDEARTGEIGDGKIFLIPVSDVIRVRTGERGLKAERMTGGRADTIASVVTI
ncbi:nitrogen regulatory protein P-II homolog [Nymphaea colorata]|nr:nitrogen regulatory protein P-II homolog [Nymphaea colorata]